MIYMNDLSDRTTHVDIVNNPDVEQFLSDCRYMVEPTGEEAKKLASMFSKIQADKNVMPNNIIAIDGGNYESSIDEKLPFTRVGYVKIGNILIKRSFFSALGTEKFVDPFKVAQITKDNAATVFAFPSSNMVYKGQTSVRDGFRLAMDGYLFKYRTNPDDYKTSLRSTLFKLAEYRLNNNEHNSGKLTLHKCPNPECSATDIILWDIQEQQRCPICHQAIYPSDCLRIWEEVEDNASNKTALTRFTNVVEHLFAIHYIRMIVESSPNSFVETLADLCFFMDGPLAIYGNAAWVHASIMKYLADLNSVLRAHNKSNILIIGLCKSGAVYDYFKLIERDIPFGSIYCLSDEIREKYVNFNRSSSSTTFGNETYYGQDFIYKTDTGRLFVFNIPYPFSTKSSTVNFKLEKAQIENYDNLSIYLSLIKEFECDLYDGAVVPTALAKRHTAISLNPGSKVLDLLTRASL